MYFDLTVPHWLWVWCTAVAQKNHSKQHTIHERFSRWPWLHFWVASGDLESVSDEREPFPVSLSCKLSIGSFFLGLCMAQKSLKPKNLATIFFLFLQGTPATPPMHGFNQVHATCDMTCMDALLEKESAVEATMDPIFLSCCFFLCERSPWWCCAFAPKAKTSTDIEVNEMKSVSQLQFPPFATCPILFRTIEAWN